MHLFNIIEIFNKFKIFEYHRIQNFSNNVDLRKQDFLSQEKISHRSHFVNKDVSQSWFNKMILIICYLLINISAVGLDTSSSIDLQAYTNWDACPLL